MELITLTNEELYNGMVNGLLPDLALEVLCDHLKSLILMMSWGYRKTIGMDEDEILQEAKLLLLNLVRKRAFTYTGKAKFSTFFVSAFRFRLYHIYRDFMLHNPMRIGDKKQMVGKGYSYEQLLAYNQRYIERYTEKQRIRAMRRVIVRRIKRSPIRHFIRGCLAASVKRRRTLYEVVPAFYSLEKSLRQFI